MRKAGKTAAVVGPPAFAGINVELVAPLSGLGQVLRDKIPVDQVIDKGLHKIRAAVLIVQIIRMLPDIAGQQRGLALGEWIDRVRCRNDLELPIIGNEPSPAAAELPGCGSLELFLEFVEAAAIAVDGRGDIAAWGATALRLHRMPEEGVVPYLCGVIENAGFRTVSICRLDDVFERLLLEWLTLDQIVQIRDIGLVMPAVMEIHRPLGDVRFKRVFRVGQGRQFKSHGDHPGLCERSARPNTAA